MLREWADDWYGPVLDADGVRVRWRASPPAFALVAVAVMFSAATAVLAVLMITGAVSEALWAVTAIASQVFIIAARKRLHRAAANNELVTPSQ